MSDTRREDGSPKLNRKRLAEVFGHSVAALIDIIAQQAQARDLSLYLAGGVVRDLLLEKRTLDLDFVLEGDAIAFGRTIATQFGGDIHSHKPFGTSKWTLDQSAARSLRLPHSEVPAHIDFVMARSEHYDNPTALPTVSAGNIEQDLQRRDFSINALALQLSPQDNYGCLLDYNGGKADLQAGLIRILHDRSFIDDPTRILRTVRFAKRLQFEIESHTAGLIPAALPMLGRITGARLRNEIDLILQEDAAGEIFQQLSDLGTLESIHPAFSIGPQLPHLLTRCSELNPPWQATTDLRMLQWQMLMSALSAEDAGSVCERLSLAQSLTKAITASAGLLERASQLNDPAIRPSQALQMLEGLPDAALHGAWLKLAGMPIAQGRISNFANDWRHKRPMTNGDDLKQMGLTPGPRYKQILDRLRYAWIDSEIATDDEERALLNQLLADAEK